MEDRALNFLGLAYRARALVTGEDVVLQAVRKGKLRLVIMSEDASENTKKRFTDKCSYYDVPLVIKWTRQSIGNAIGKDERVVVGVEESGFAKKLKSLME
ncbi:YlxQ family RNA-binding protein [Alteribacter populi]|uniref:YlxQ family RNA-binding protein n=1 Tax=Alteribacter populi TaxID=2011011 RepID=UPI000BBB5A55|nr:YlxQ family RNA-binding protein [Alteribacter populi]